MMPAKNIFLRSSSINSDPNFSNTILYIAAYNEQGAMGFIVNQKFLKPLNALAEFSGSAAFPLYDGGPVDKEHLYFIHRCPQLIEGGENISGEVYLGGNFKQAVDEINYQRIDTRDIKIFVGYCGWDTGELEAEIEEGDWEIIEANIFNL